MTDPTGTGIPGAADDRLGGDTPGPDATPEQEAFVAGLLGSLRSDDPAIPDHVAARVDGVLAELRRNEPVGPGAARPLVDAEDGAGTSGTADGTHGTGSASDEATVLPMPAGRESTSTRTFRWVAGAAAAVVVLGAGAAVVRGAFTGAGSSAGTAMSAEDTSGALRAAPIRTSGTDYRSDALASQALALVSATSVDGGPAPQGPEGTPEVAPTTSPSGVANARTLLTTATLAACLEQLTGAPGAAPVAIDQGSYEGKPADVVVLPSPDDAARLEVWVIGPGCTRENVVLYEFRTIPLPGATGQPTDPGTEASEAPTPATDPSTSPSP